MIILSEVAQKLEKILNGQDGEVTATNPTGFYFQVETEGFHIDHIEKKEKDGNFIPVFISSLGGQFNPVKGLKQGSYSFPVIFYFPVRFKEAFFALGDFLVDAFVGTILNYGEISGKAVSNISVPQFGEIQDLDLGQFGKWVESQYKKPIEVMEPYLTMQVTLFLSNAAAGLVYGNDVKADLSFTDLNGVKHTLEDINWDGSSLQSNAQAQSEQEEGTSEATSVPFGTSYGASLKIYPDLNALAKGTDDVYFYRELLKIWLEGNIQNIKTEVTFTIGDPAYGLQYTRKCYIQSIVAPIEKGQILGLTLTFIKATDFEEDD